MAHLVSRRAVAHPDTFTRAPATIRAPALPGKLTTNHVVEKNNRQRNIIIGATVALILSATLVVFSAIALSSQTLPPKSEFMWKCKLLTIVVGQSIGQSPLALPAFLTIIGGTGMLVSGGFLIKAAAFPYKTP